MSNTDTNNLKKELIVEVTPLSFKSYLKLILFYIAIGVIFLALCIVADVINVTIIVSLLAMLYYRLWSPLRHAPYKVSFYSDRLELVFYVLGHKWIKSFPYDTVVMYHLIPTKKKVECVTIVLNNSWKRYHLNYPSRRTNWDHTSIEKVLTIAENYCKVIKVRNN